MRRVFATHFLHKVGCETQPMHWPPQIAYGEAGIEVRIEIRPFVCAPHVSEDMGKRSIFFASTRSLQQTLHRSSVTTKSVLPKIFCVLECLFYGLFRYLVSLENRSRCGKVPVNQVSPHAPEQPLQISSTITSCANPTVHIFPESLLYKQSAHRKVLEIGSGLSAQLRCKVASCCPL
jgi:hypothetical protein